MDFQEANDADPINDKLDVEYRQILRIIKPYIQTINNNTHLAQYRIWLEKLSEAKENEKFVRNQYLMELARQIQCKHLTTPFTQVPPRGTLPAIRVNQWNFEDVPYDLQLDDSYMNKQKMCQQWAEDNEAILDLEKTQWPYHTRIPRPRRPSSYQQLQTAEQQHFKDAQRSATSVKKISLIKETDEQHHEDVGCLPLSRPTRPLRMPPSFLSTPSYSSTDQKAENETKKRKSFTPKYLFLGVIPEDISEDESCCKCFDKSSTSLNVFASGDAEAKERRKADSAQGDNLEKKINTLMIEINGLKKKSQKVDEKSEQAVRRVEEHLPPKNLTSSEGVRLKRFPERIFPSSDTDVVVDKVSNEKDGNYLTSDWKKIIESLQVRLSETQQQNKELNSLVSTLHKRIKEMDASKEQVKQEIKKQIAEEHKKELESSNANEAQIIKEIEATHQTQIKEIEDNFEKEKNKIKEEYEIKSKEIDEQNSIIHREKDKEIRRLENIIQEECTRLVSEITVLRRQIEEASITNTTNDERILFLQKCITKMDRLFQKSEREYCRQIEKLKHELDNREKAIQIQLQTQKAEVISTCSANKQVEIDVIVQNLESKYTQLLEAQQNQIAHVKEEDEKIFNQLKSILDQHNIPY